MIKVFLFFSILAAIPSFAQLTSLEAFNSTPYEVELTTLIHGHDAGEILYKLKGETIDSIETRSLKAKLSIILKNGELENIDLTQTWIKVSEVPFPINYDGKTLLVHWNIPLEKLKPIFKYMDHNPSLKYAGIVKLPAPISFGLDLDYEQKIGDEELEGGYQSLFYESYLRTYGLVFSHRGFYEQFNEEEDGKWYHLDKNMTKDFLSTSTRLQLGDTRSKNFGFLSSYQIGGISLKKEFSLNPYYRFLPQGEDEFQVYSRSQVKTYVNGSLVKDEFLPAGNYRFTNLPLINGINLIRVEIKDSFGEKRILEYNIPTSISLLKKGENNYSLSIGRPYFDNNNIRNYEDKNLASGFYQYGLSSQYTLGGYFQNHEYFNLLGLSQGSATNVGNLFGEFSSSKRENDTGYAFALIHQLQTQSLEFFSGLSFLSRYENYNKNFHSTYDGTDSVLKESLDLSISSPVGKNLSLTIGGGLATYQNLDLDKRKRLNFSGNLRFSRTLNLNFYTSKVNSSQGEDVSASLFLTWNIDAGNHYATIYRDTENNQNRVTYTFDNNNRLYRPRVNASVEENLNDEQKKIDLNLNMPMNMTNLGLRYGKTIGDGQDFEVTSLRAQTTLAMAYDNGFGFGISRNQGGSLSIFTKEGTLEDQRLKLKSSSPFVESQTPLIGDITLSGLTPYQYRSIEIDPSELEDGISLEREKFVLKPEYKSIHIVKLKALGAKSIKGQLWYKGQTVFLGVGKLGEKVFFTDRKGYFYLEGVNSESLDLFYKGEVKKINIDKSKTGIVDIGKVEL